MRHLFITLIAAVLTVAGVLGWYLSTSLPRADGEAVLPGLQERVVVRRDVHGVPHIKAASDHDAYAALGYVHAQDRFWQMEMNRRAGAGRMSEVLGVAALETDRFLRTLGLYRLAEASLGYLRPEVREALQAYADGVNGWLRSRDGALPPEFVLLRYQPEPWTPADSLVWGRLMGLQLAGNWRDELLRQRVAAVLPADRTAMLWAPYPSGAPTTVTLAQGALDSMLAAIPDLLQPHLASNQQRLVGGGKHGGDRGGLFVGEPVRYFDHKVHVGAAVLSVGAAPADPHHPVALGQLAGEGRVVTQRLHHPRQVDPRHVLLPDADAVGPLPFEGVPPVHRSRMDADEHLVRRGYRFRQVAVDELLVIALLVQIDRFHRATTYLTH